MANQLLLKQIDRPFHLGFQCYYKRMSSILTTGAIACTELDGTPISKISFSRVLTLVETLKRKNIRH